MIKRLLFIIFLTPFTLMSQTWSGSNITPQIGSNCNLVGLGKSVAISGDGSTYAAGSPDYHNPNPNQICHYSGSGLIYVRKTSLPNQHNANYYYTDTTLYGPLLWNGGFGTSLSLNYYGDILAVGSNSLVRCYKWNGTNWVQMGADIPYQGINIEQNKDGTKIIIQSPHSNSPGGWGGSIRVFEWNGNSWIQIGSTISTNSSGTILKDIAINNTGTIIASSGWPGTKIFELINNSWSQKGQTLNTDGYSNAVDLNGSGLKVAHIYNDYSDPTTPNYNAIRVFQWVTTTSSWIQFGNDIYHQYQNQTFPGNWPITNFTFAKECDIICSHRSGNQIQPHNEIFKMSGGSWSSMHSFTGNWNHSPYRSDLLGYSLSFDSYGRKLICGAPTINNSWGSGDVHLYAAYPSSNSSNLLYGSFINCSPYFQTECDSYAWIDGNTYYNSIYIDTLITNEVGCLEPIIMDLTINSNTGTDVQTACDSYSWIDGNTYTSSTNTPTYTLTNAAGCDSVVTLILSLNTVNNTISNTTPTLMADATGATYQWLDCINNYAPILGETNQSFTATSNGSYAVEVTQNGCVDTSACEQVNNVGINEINSSITLHPNPTNGIVELQGINGSFKVDVYDYAGKYLQSTSRSTIDLSDFTSGIYLLKVAYGDRVEEVKVIKD